MNRDKSNLTRLQWIAVQEVLGAAKAIANALDSRERIDQEKKFEDTYLAQAREQLLAARDLHFLEPALKMLTNPEHEVDKLPLGTRAELEKLAAEVLAL